MIYKKSNIVENYFEEFIFGIILLVNLILQFVLLVKFGDKATFPILALNFVYVIVLFHKYFFKNVYIYLLILTTAPLLYINNPFHYVFRIEVISNAALYLLLLLAIAQYLSQENFYVVRLSKFQKIIFLFVLLSILSSIYGIMQGYDKERIVMEFYHYFYYFFAFVFYFVFKNRKEYLLMFKILVAIFLFVSLTHIAFFALSGGERFVSYQSNFTPFILGLVLAYLLLSKDKRKRILSFLLLIPLLVGEILTLTRSLWVTTLIVLGLVLLIYLINFRNWKWIALVIFSFTVIFTIIYMQSDIGSSQSQPQPNIPGKNIEARSQSILSPGEDTSFLMRVEFGYYTIQRFLSNPIVGTGIGDELHYKLFQSAANASLPKSYPDNTWLYFLWKQGLLGLGIFLWMYLIFLKKSFFIFKHTNDVIVKSIALALIAGTIGTFFNGMLTAVMIKYKLNLLFAFLFAYVEFESRRVEDKIKLDKLYKTQF